MKTVIFDLDGTLLDTTEGVVESAKYAAKMMGCDDLPEETWLSFVGPPIQESFIKHFHFTKEEAQKAANIFRDYYKNVALLKAKAYEGIFDVCSSLKGHGCKLCVATYKREDYAIQLLNHFGFEEFFDLMHGADNDNKLSKSDIIELCINETHSEKNHCVLIGDTVYDAKGAEEIGIRFLAVTYGFGFKKGSDVLVSNLGVADKPMDILSILF